MLDPLDSSFDADFYADLAEFSCQDNFCNILDLIGAPPDMILDLPPPPIPSFLKGLNILNDSENAEKCNHCSQFTDQTIDGLSFTLPKQAQSGLLTNNSLLISGGLLIVSLLCLIALYIKYKKMKISMVDTCASFSQSFFSKANKDLQVSARVDSCAPVVNEKTPQSIITNSPSKKSTIIPAKYWKTPTGNGINFAHGPNGHHLMVNEFNGALIDSTITTEMSEYMPEEGSCTSSPVYQEISSAHQINLDNMSNLITMNNFNNLNPMAQPVRYKAYTMRNYGDMPNAAKLSQLNQLNQLNQLAGQMDPDSALLPDVSYDNEAYLPSSNSDYHNKSLKRNRQSTLGKLGSKTPLLSTHCPTMNVNPHHSLTLGYLNAEKPKQTFIQHQLGSRINVNNTLMLKSQEPDPIGGQPRYVQGNKKNILIYNGQPIISKRPLPSVPNMPKLPNNFI